MMRLKDTDRVSNSVDPDQTATEGEGSNLEPQLRFSVTTLNLRRFSQKCVELLYISLFMTCFGIGQAHASFWSFVAADKRPVKMNK